MGLCSALSAYVCVLVGLSHVSEGITVAGVCVRARTCALARTHVDSTLGYVLSPLVHACVCGGRVHVSARQYGM